MEAWLGLAREVARPRLSPLPRIALYSPDSYGLGHYRRSRRVAAALVDAFPGASVLMLTGCVAAGRFGHLTRTDHVRLPSATKSPTGVYRSRSLGIELDQLRHLRAAILEASLRAFQPDVLIVDHAPAGLAGELRPALEMLRVQRRPTLVALGLRDIIDDVQAVRREWAENDTLALIERSYDEVWVYGRPEVFDPVHEYRIPSRLARRFRYVGYVTEAPPAQRTRRRRAQPLVVAMGGGGEDAHPLLAAAVRAHARAPHEFRLWVLPGAMMPGQQKRELELEAAALPGVKVLPFQEDAAAVIARADCVVTMGDYNSMLEVLAAGVPSLVVPRTSPRQEQLIRAKRMAALGWISWIHPDDVTPETLLEGIRGQLNGAGTVRIPGEFLAGAGGVVDRCRRALATLGEPVPVVEELPAG